MTKPAQIKFSPLEVCDVNDWQKNEWDCMDMQSETPTPHRIRVNSQGDILQTIKDQRDEDTYTCYPDPKTPGLSVCRVHFGGAFNLYLPRKDWEGMQLKLVENVLDRLEGFKLGADILPPISSGIVLAIEVSLDQAGETRIDLQSYAGNLDYKNTPVRLMLNNLRENGNVSVLLPPNHPLAQKFLERHAAIRKAQDTSLSDRVRQGVAATIRSIFK